MAVPILAASYDITIERGVAYLERYIVCYDDIPPPDGDGEPVSLTGFTPHAHARKVLRGPIIKDLEPEIVQTTITVDDIEVEVDAVKLGKFTDEDTLTFKRVENGVWSLVLENSDGDWLPAIVSGVYNCNDSATRNEP